MHQFHIRINKFQHFLCSQQKKKTNEMKIYLIRLFMVVEVLKRMSKIFVFCYRMGHNHNDLIIFFVFIDRFQYSNLTEPSPSIFCRKQIHWKIDG